jgi:hypothetical protein
MFAAIAPMVAGGYQAFAATNPDAIVYLPLTMSDAPRQATIFGTQIQRLGSENVSELIDEADLYWVRISAFDWDKIEPMNTSPATYHWDAVNSAMLKKISQNGASIIATIRFAPDWALKYSNHACGPIKQQAFTDFADFLKDLVQRYSGPPYNIKYWEIGNEPDVDRGAFSEPRPDYGCWGDASDDYYGGAYYAQMLAQAYPAIKSADPSAKVLIGGLLLDCDPANPPADRTDGCKSAKFFEGILRAGGASYFDIVSFHGYPPYIGSLKWDEQNPGWANRGGVVLGKIRFLREVMANYGVDKPLILTEGSLICPEWNAEDCNPPTAAFYEAQADYVAWLYVRNWAEGLLGTVWYKFEGPGWRYGSLLDDNQNPRPAYKALNFIIGELKSATYSGQVTEYEGLRVYEFTAPSKKIWVMWAPDEQPHNVQLPGNVTRIYDKYGNILSAPENQLSVKSPVYIELAP